jgi:hypothetical protein
VRDETGKRRRLSVHYQFTLSEEKETSLGTKGREREIETKLKDPRVEYIIKKKKKKKGKKGKARKRRK